MEPNNKWPLVLTRVLIAMVLLLNGFGAITQPIPTDQMIASGAPARIVPSSAFAGRMLEAVAGFGLALGIFPRWCAFALMAFLLPATFLFHSFWPSIGATQLQGQLINFSRNVAIWGVLIFIAGTRDQPSLVPRSGNRALP